MSETDRQIDKLTDRDKLTDIELPVEMYQIISQVSSVSYYFGSNYDFDVRIWSTKKQACQCSPRWSSSRTQSFCSGSPGFKAALPRPIKKQRRGWRIKVRWEVGTRRMI